MIAGLKQTWPAGILTVPLTTESKAALCPVS